MATQQAQVNNTNEQQLPAPVQHIAPTDEEMDSDDDDEEVEALRQQMRNMQANHEAELRVINMRYESMESQLQQVLAIQQNQSTMQRNQVNDLNNLTTTAATGRDAGEILKPNAPEPFSGDARDLQIFFTKMRTYFTYFPT